MNDLNIFSVLCLQVFTQLFTFELHVNRNRVSGRLDLDILSLQHISFLVGLGNKERDIIEQCIFSIIFTDLLAGCLFRDLVRIIVQSCHVGIKCHFVLVRGDLGHGKDRIVRNRLRILHNCDHFYILIIINILCLFLSAAVMQKNDSVFCNVFLCKGGDLRAVDRCAVIFEGFYVQALGPLYGHSPGDFTFNGRFCQVQSILGYGDAQSCIGFADRSVVVSEYSCHEHGIRTQIFFSCLRCDRQSGSGLLCPGLAGLRCRRLFQGVRRRLIPRFLSRHFAAVDSLSVLIIFNILAFISRHGFRGGIFPLLDLLILVCLLILIDHLIVLDLLFFIRIFNKGFILISGILIILRVPGGIGIFIVLRTIRISGLFIVLCVLRISGILKVFRISAIFIAFRILGCRGSILFIRLLRHIDGEIVLLISGIFRIRNGSIRGGSFTALRRLLLKLFLRGLILLSRCRAPVTLRHLCVGFLDLKSIGGDRILTHGLIFLH